jgi:hypothetical protein
MGSTWDSPRTSQVMKASTLEISEIMTKGNGERLHFGHSFIGMTRSDRCQWMTRYRFTGIGGLEWSWSSRAHRARSFSTLRHVVCSNALRIRNLMVEMEVFQPTSNVARKNESRDPLTAPSRHDSEGAARLDIAPERVADG